MIDAISISGGQTSLRSTNSKLLSNFNFLCFLNNTNRRIDQVSGLSETSTGIAKPRAGDQIEAPSTETRCPPYHHRRVPTKPSDSLDTEHRFELKLWINPKPWVTTGSILTILRIFGPQNKRIDKLKIKSKFDACPSHIFIVFHL